MPHRFVWRKSKEFLVHRVLHVDDTPHRLALGVAIGIFVTWTPTIGFQMLLTVALAWLLRANKLVGIPFVWISNPLTLVPIYLPSYYLGRWLLGSDVPPPDFGKVLSAGGGWLETLRTWWSVTWHAFLPLWIGSLLVALALGLLSYFAMYHTIVIYRRRRNVFHLQPVGRRHRDEPAGTNQRTGSGAESAGPPQD
jgi:hypothetical protein